VRERRGRWRRPPQLFAMHRRDVSEFQSKRAATLAAILDVLRMIIAIAHLLLLRLRLVLAAQFRCGFLRHLP
jgi:hypothetical protein